MKNCTKLKQCIACGHEDLELCVDLGQQPLANNYLDSVIAPENTYPLAVNLCKNCSHLQLTHIVDPKIIYTNYSYVSGTSQTYIDYMDWFARWCREYSDCYYGYVLDIGCNDGSQLNAFKQIGFSTYGVDPAENLYELSRKNHKVVCDFWSKDAVKKLKHHKFDIVVSQNAFAHVPDPIKYLETLKPLLKDKGLFFVQTSQANMVVNGEFDTIYHEHISFYNIKSMRELAKRAGWNLIDAVKTPIHGTSYVFVLSLDYKQPKHVKNLIAMEQQLQDPATYTSWHNQVQNIKSQFELTINDYKKSGYKIVGYGAAAKGMTLLNFANRACIDYIIDDNPLKQGKFTPGQKIPIVNATYLETLSDTDRVLFVPLAWNFYTEIRKKIHTLRNNSDDRFLKYFPEVVVEY